MERPNFETISIALIRCGRNPDTCPDRHQSVSRGVTTFYCWHPESPMPDQQVTDTSYRICVTKPKEDGVART